MILRRPTPIHVIQGEAFDHPFTLRDKATGVALDPWPDTIRVVLARGGTEVECTLGDPTDDGLFLASLTGDATGDLVVGLWGGGLEVNGRTWLKVSFIVEADPTPP